MKFLYAFIFRVYYLNWGRIYRFFQRLFTWDYKLKVATVQKTMTQVTQNHALPQDRYRELWRQFPHIRWKCDAWYMLWDVIADPYLALYQGDDCDSFALLGYRFFGDDIVYQSESYSAADLLDEHKYTFKCFYFMMFEPAPWGGGHCVAIWENNEGNMWVVSNQEIVWHQSEAAMLRWALVWGIVQYVVEVSGKLKYIKTRRIDD